VKIAVTISGSELRHLAEHVVRRLRERRRTPTVIMRPRTGDDSDSPSSPPTQPANRRSRRDRRS
jgi:hypothetical protein